MLEGIELRIDENSCVHPAFVGLDEIAQRESNLSVRAAFNLVTGDFEGLTADSWRTADNSLRDEVSFIHRLNTEPTRRWANGFSCLCFVLIGAPLAMWWRNSDTMFIFFVCFGPILIVYYPLLVFGLDAANAVVSEADFVLAVGSKLWPTDTAFENHSLLDPERSCIGALACRHWCHGRR